MAQVNLRLSIHFPWWTKFFFAFLLTMVWLGVDFDLDATIQQFVERYVKVRAH